MEHNPAYHYGQRSSQLDDHLYEEVDTQTTKRSSITHEEVQNPVREKTNSKLAGKKQRGANIVLAIAIVAVLALAVIAIIVSVLLTSNSNQEIHTLQLKIENLREMLNQTGDNSNQEIHTLQLEIENLREMLNQTGDNSNQEIQSLQLEIDNLRKMLNQTGDSLAIQVSTLRNENQERDRKYILIALNILHVYSCMININNERRYLYL